MRAFNWGVTVARRRRGGVRVLLAVLFGVLCTGCYEVSTGDHKVYRLNRITGEVCSIVKDTQHGRDDLVEGGCTGGLKEALGKAL